MNTKCVSITWLSKVDLSNINSGEGGAGNVVELKMYKHGKRPYASGQSVRHALREALERGNPGCFISTPEAPSCDIAKDWLCDLFGYLNPKAGEGSDRRWSPVKSTPALGQIDCEVVTDMLTRLSDLEKQDSTKKDSRIAYVQLAENIFKVAMTIDVNAVGRKLVIVGDSKAKRIDSREWQDIVSIEERKKRIKAIIMALGQMGDFAKQARNAVSFAPDIFLAAVSPIYTQRGLRALDLNSDGDVDVTTLEVIIKDLRSLKSILYLGYTPNVIGNDKELLDICTKYNIAVGSPIDTLQKVADGVE